MVGDYNGLLLALWGRVQSAELSFNWAQVRIKHAYKRRFKHSLRLPEVRGQCCNNIINSFFFKKKHLVRELERERCITVFNDGKCTTIVCRAPS
jgi:hypothetical protein